MKTHISILFLFIVSLAKSQTISTVAGNGSSGFSGDDGNATEARLNLPFNLTFDKNDNFYIADTYNNSIRKVSSESGIITTVVGSPDKKHIHDLKTPTGLTFDNQNNLYVADLANLRIKLINLDYKKAMTLVGQPTETDVPNIKASLAGPISIVFDGKNELYITTNGDSKVISVNIFTGDITDIAGTGVTGYSGDGGQAKGAQLANPTGLALDNKTLYIADSGNERVRKVNLDTGIITTVAGTGETGFGTEGNYALKTKLSNPVGLAVDKNGDLYIVDRGNNRVIMVNKDTQLISRVTGNGEAGFSGDGDLAKNAQLSNPTGLAFNHQGDLFIVDRGNNRIRKITGLSEMQEPVVLEDNIIVYPNPAKEKVTLQVKEPLKIKDVFLYDSRGKEIKLELLDNTLNVSKLPRGIYVIRVATDNGTLEQKLVLE